MIHFNNDRLRRYEDLIVNTTCSVYIYPQSTFTPEQLMADSVGRAGYLLMTSSSKLVRDAEGYITFQTPPGGTDKGLIAGTAYYAVFAYSTMWKMVCRVGEGHPLTLVGGNEIVVGQIKQLHSLSWKMTQ